MVRQRNWCRRLLLALSVAATSQVVAAAEPSRPAPFFDARQQTAEYAGPGRESADPIEVDEVLIGYFGPSDPADPRGGDMWRAAEMAVAEANRQGGYQGKPFRLVPGWSEDPWGTGVVTVTRMAYHDRVWGIIGGIDGPTTHLAEQVVAKARLVLVSPVSTDKTVNLANVPWMFSCMPDDSRLAEALADRIDTEATGSPLVLVSTNDHDSHHFTGELRKCLAKRQVVPRFHFVCKPGESKAEEVAESVARAKPAALVIIADGPDSARLLSAIRKQGFAGKVFGGPAMGRKQFVEYIRSERASFSREAAKESSPGLQPRDIEQKRSREPRRGDMKKETPSSVAPAGLNPEVERLSRGLSPGLLSGVPSGLLEQTTSRRVDEASEGVVFTLLWEPGPRADEFTARFEKTHDTSPDYAAAGTYDATRLLIAAINKAGLNRARIRDALKELSPWPGVSGTVRWDGLGSNHRAVRLGTIRSGRAVPVATPRGRDEPTR